MGQDRERFDRGVLVSLGLHVLLTLIVFFSPILFPAYGDASWGDQGAGDGMSVSIVSSISGVPLPAPAIVNDEAAANESEGFYETEPEPEQPPEPEPEAPVEEAELIPETIAPVETTPPPPPAPPAPPPAPKPAEPESTPEQTNAVPFGEGGRPSINYGQTGGEGAGVGAVGEGAFGERYGSYVQAITQRISQNWLQAMVSGNVRNAPRIYISFDILRDGTITNVEITTGSGIASLDRSARRAIFASNPLGPLPSDFRGRSINVSFWFDYQK